MVQGELPVRCMLMCANRTFVRLAHMSVRVAHVARCAFRTEAIPKGRLFINLSLFNQ